MADTDMTGRHAAIEAVDLSKSYGEVDAVRGVSFTVQAGEVFAFLGPSAPEAGPTVGR